MPTETRGRIKQTISKYYNGRTGGSTGRTAGRTAAATDHAESSETHSPENNPYQSLRSKYAPNSGAKSANPDSNGTIRRRRSTVLPSRSSAPSTVLPSRSSAPSDRPAAAKLRAEDVISLYQQIAKERKRDSAVTEHSDGRRSSHGSKPPAAGGSESAAFGHREELRLSEELFEVPLEVFFNNLPSMRADQYRDFPQKLAEGRPPHAKHLNRRPSTTDGPVGKAWHSDLPSSLPAVKEMRRSSSFSIPGDLAKPSAGDRKSPDRLSRRQPFAHKRSNSFSTRPSRVEQPNEPRPYTGSNTTPAHQAERTSQESGGSSTRSSSNSSNPNLKLQKANPRFVSSTNSTSPIATTMPSSGKNGHFDVKVDNAGSNIPKARTPTIDSWKTDARDEKPATFATSSHARAMSSHARHDDKVNGSFRQKDFRTVQDVNGRLHRRSKSKSRTFRQEDASDLAADSGQRSKSKRHEHESHLTSRRLESRSGNSPLEDPVNYVHGKQEGTGGNLSKDRTSGTRGRMMNRRTTENVENRRDSESHSSASLSSDSKRRPGSHHSTKVSIKGVAAAWYNRGWLLLDGMADFPEDIAGFNKFLSDCKTEVDSDVPGRVLTVVLGKDSSDDLGSIVSTIVYAYFLSCTGTKGNSKSFVPVINMRQEDLVLHTEAVWLFQVTGVDTSNFIFVDQISLQSYHRFGNLKLVLVDHSRLAPHQENLKEAVIEIVDNTVTGELYEWVLTRDIQEVGSCCTIIAERFAAEAPEHLAGHGLSRLLLGPILLETANLDASSARCTSRDECMAALLVNGAGRYGRQGFVRLLRKMKLDISLMSTMDMLRKDFKKWTVGPGTTNVHGCEGRVITVAMSTVGVPIWDVMDRKDVLEDLKRFQKKFQLDLHLVVTGYYDIHDRYKREILLVPEDRELTQHVDTCFSAHEEALKLSVIDIKGLPEEILVFKQGQVTASRRVLRQILEDYFAM